jgi:hypothetical protein
VAPGWFRHHFKAALERRFRPSLLSPTHEMLSEGACFCLPRTRLFAAAVRLAMTLRKGQAFVSALLDLYRQRISHCWLVNNAAAACYSVLGASLAQKGYTDEVQHEEPRFS